MTVIQGGDDLFKYRPFEPDADGNSTGPYRGDNEALNIEGAQPGCHYYLARSKDDRQLGRLLNQGAQPVRSGDPEKFGFARLPSEVQSQIDGLQAYKDVVLLRIPGPAYRKMQESKSQASLHALQGVTASYLDAGEQHTQALGNNAPSNQLYYAKHDHGIVTEDL